MARPVSVLNVRGLTNSSPPRSNMALLGDAAFRAEAAATYPAEAAPKYDAPLVTKAQLIRVAASASVGMIGFGFVDNFVMITAGDAIDASLNSTFAVSAMCAAALGNTMSDIVGYYTGDAMEAACVRLGIGTPPPLSPEQKEDPSVKSAQRHGAAIGLTVGCLLGMCPLLWTKSRRVNISPEELQFYNDIFASERVEVADFRTLMDAGVRREAKAGEIIVHGDQPLNSVIIIADGLCEDKRRDGTPDVGFAAVRTWKGFSQYEPQQLKGCVKKMVIGGTKLVDTAMYGEDDHEFERFKRVYPSTITARGTVTYYRWDLDRLVALCESNQSLERAFCALVRKDSKERTQLLAEREKGHYTVQSLELLVKAVIADRIVCTSERELVAEFCATHCVSNEVLETVLENHGWTLAAWKKGVKK